MAFSALGQADIGGPSAVRSRPSQRHQRSSRPLAVVDLQAPTPCDTAYNIRVPIFIDIEPETFTINPQLVEVGIATAKRLGHNVVGVIGVDLHGQPADYDQLNSVATKFNLWTLADAAQSFGACYSGTRVGSLANITATGFFPGKPLGCYGDGGALFTNDSNLATVARSLRVHGQGKDKFDHIRVGLNSRLDTLQAAVLLSKLEIFTEELAMRQEIASQYSTLLDGAVQVPFVNEYSTSTWASYTIRTNERDALQQHLNRNGIPTAIYYPCPLHLQPAYQKYPVMTGGCLIAEMVAREILSLPMHPYLREDTQMRIVETVKSLGKKANTGIV
ncbi:Pyridoxal phosphate-dependent transferase [Elaphomyces granulatus]